MTNLTRFSGLLAAIVLSSCQHESNQLLFTAIPSSHSHIDFRNDIQESEDYNILTYEYLYNGGGVATGDLNNDGLPDIVFTGNMTPNKLYMNKGGLQFEDVAEQAGIQGRSKWKTGVVMADVNGDGLLDIYVCYSGPGTDEERANELYINNGVKNGILTFTESAKQYGLDAPGTYTTTVSFFDMDNDGDLDLFMVNHADMFFNPYFNTNQLRAARNPKFGNRLYRNEEGHFTDISAAAHIDGSGLNFGLSVAISDINNDGWADIYVTNDYDERDFLYLNNHDGTFREVLTKATGHISEFAMGSDIADYNNDERTDILVLDMLPEDNYRQKLLKGPDTYDRYMMRVNAGFHKQQMRNTLQLNNGMDSSGIPLFSETGQLAGLSNTDWSWAPLFADFDNDGWKDVFISNGIFRDFTNLDYVKYTSGYSAQYTKRAGNKKDMWQLVQQMPSIKLRNYVFRNNHDLGFTNMTDAWGFTKKSISNGAAYADLDNDGDLDLVINNLNDEATIYRNNTSGTAKTHFIKIRLIGEGRNRFGIGAKVRVQTAAGAQVQEQFISRGFQSSVDPVMHMGLGSDSLLQTIQVTWPGGKTSLVQDVTADTLLVILEKDASPAGSPEQPAVPVKQLFEHVTHSSGIHFIHKQTQYVDFKISPLLPYQLSKTGPCLAKADVNGDGLEDLFIGTSAGQASALYLQTAAGAFILDASEPWNNEKEVTNTGALFFDADKDGDVDLYLVSGGADHPLNSSHYQDRLYENDGRGHFSRVVDALPVETVSGSCAQAADMNKDGLPDLFVGGSFQPGRFPEAPESFMLKNKSIPGRIRFEKDAQQTDTLLAHPGMVTDAAWQDMNKDGWEDLIVVGRFMPVCIFENHQGKLVDATAAYGLGNTNGWWCRLLAGDFDRDGDPDLVIGNLGSNTPFKPSPEEPLSITYGDFYGNGFINPVLCYYNQGKRYPYYSKDEMAEQMPFIHKKFLRYTDYAGAQLTDLLTGEQLAKSSSVEIKTTQSAYLQNDGNKKMTIKYLPAMAQISTANGLLEADVDQDGNKDVILAGNFYPFRVQLGPLDGAIGLVLKGNGKGDFMPLPYPATGLCLTGDVRNMVMVKGKNGSLIAAARNDGALELLKLLH